MTVTLITEISKTRSKVYIDQEFAFVLYKGELRLFGIKEGAEVAAEDYHRIIEEILPKRAKLRCMNLLKSRAYTREQLREKLQKGGYPETVIETALDYVASFRYIDDEQYAMDFITYNHEKKSRRRMEEDLSRKGIDRSTVQRIWEQWEEEGNSQDEETQIKYWLEKKHFDPTQSDQKQRQKIYAFLMRKGFSGEKILHIFRKIGEDII